MPARDSVSFSDVEYELIVVNPGSPDAFVASQTIAEEVRVLRDSSAIMRRTVLTSPRFVSEVDRLHWQAAGRRPFASSTDRAGESFRTTFPPGAFSFTPHGRPVTFRQAYALPGNVRALTQQLRRLLGAPTNSTPPATLSLWQYGFLLATAPLTPAGRAAILEAIGGLPGLYECDRLFGTHRPRGDAFCVDGNPTTTEILLNPESGVAVLACERLDDRTPLYPNLPVGSLVNSVTFSLKAR